MVTAQKTGSRVPRTPKNQIWKLVKPLFRSAFWVFLGPKKPVFLSCNYVSCPTKVMPGGYNRWRLRQPSNFSIYASQGALKGPPGWGWPGGPKGAPWLSHVQKFVGWLKPLSLKLSIFRKKTVYSLCQNRFHSKGGLWQHIYHMKLYHFMVLYNFMMLYHCLIQYNLLMIY